MFNDISFFTIGIELLNMAKPALSPLLQTGETRGKKAWLMLVSPHGPDSGSKSGPTKGRRGRLPRIDGGSTAIYIYICNMYIYIYIIVIIIMIRIHFTCIVRWGYKPTYNLAESILQVVHRFLSTYWDTGAHEACTAIPGPKSGPRRCLLWIHKLAQDHQRSDFPNFLGSVC